MVNFNQEELIMKRYTDDFKRDAIRYLDEHPEMTRIQVAQYLGIPKDTLYGWTKTAYRNKLFGTSDPVPAPKTEQDREIERLKRELRDAKDALEILKKAISILND